MVKEFSFAAIMSVATAQSLASTPDGREEENELLQHLTRLGAVKSYRDKLKIYEMAQGVLFRQFPNLNTGESQFATGKLLDMLESEMGRSDRTSLIRGWLFEQAPRLRMSLDKPIPVKGIEASADEKIAKAIELAARYRSTDVASHKDWVIDQMVRILAGDTYEEVVRKAKAGEYGPKSHSWRVGVAP